MLRNYLKITFRNLRQRPGYTVINVTGLAVGMACCILIALFVQDELSFDEFHGKADRIYLVGQNPEDPFIATQFPLGPTLEQEFPEVKETVTMTYSGSGLVRHGNTVFKEEENILFTTPSFLDVFTFPLLRGNPETVLKKPNSVVITKNTARKYFGDENPMGQTLTIEVSGQPMTFTVTGIAKPVPHNSYIQFVFLIPISAHPSTEGNASSWRASMYRTFALLGKGQSAKTLESKFPTMVERHTDLETNYFMKPMDEVYLSDLAHTTGFKGDPRYLYIFSAIALFILLIGSINYMILATARSTERAKEVGVRKTVGAHKLQVAGQFLSESLLLSLGALVLALGLADLALPAFNAVFGKELDLVYADNGLFLLGLLGLAIGVGLISGSYPALYLSAFNPVRVLKGDTRRGRSNSWLRRGLIVLQFTISITLIAGTTVIYKQLDYMQNKKLGFNEEQLVTIPLRSDQLRSQYAAIKRAFLQHPDVLRATASYGVPSRFHRYYQAVAKRAKSPNADGEAIMVAIVNVDYDYLETLGMELVAGRDFYEKRATDATHAFIINEATADELGWSSAVGKKLMLSGVTGEIIGVVKDFHFNSLREKIGPVAFRVLPPDGEEQKLPYTMITARLSADNISGAMDYLKKQWEKFAPNRPFQYTFLDEAFDRMYRTERRLSRVFSAFTFIAIFIACMGLFGLAAFTAQQRTKEIGIRKVLGASVTNIVTLLSKDFIKLVGIAIIIAAPLAYFAMQHWLANFAYRIEIGVGTFVLAGGTAIVIALLTVSYQSIKAALANPADSLRYE